MTLVVIGTDFTGSCKSNYHAIMTTPTPQSDGAMCCDQCISPLKIVNSILADDVVYSIVRYVIKYVCNLGQG